MKRPRDLLPLLTGAVFLLMALAFAWWSLTSFLKADYGSMLIYAGVAIALGTLPLSRLSKPDLLESINEPRGDAVGKPEPLPLRLAITLAWLLMVAGFVSFFL